MLKKILLSIFCVAIIVNIKAQEESGGWNWNKTFVGGSVLLGFGFGNNSQSTYGINPEIGYSAFKHLDFGLAGNLIFSSTNITKVGSAYTEKYRLSQLGIGVFARLHITDGFFLHVQPEINSIKYKRFAEPDIPAFRDEQTFKSSSVLAGIGWGSRSVSDMNYFTTILIDLQKDLYSPYRTVNGDVSPVFRTGVNWYFNRRKK